MKLKREKKEKSKVNPKKMLQERKSYADRKQEELELKGVVFFEPDKTLDIDSSYLNLPSNITEVSSKDLGEYLNAYTQQKAYMRTLLGWAEMYSEEAEMNYRNSSSKKYTELSGTKLSEKAKDREVNSDPEIVPFYEEYIDKQNACRLLEMNIKTIEDIIFLLSREVSRRTGDFGNENRNINVNNR